MNLESLIREYLEQGTVMQLATVHDGQPWQCSIHFALDDNWNMYWLSNRQTRHSKELAAHPQAAGAVLNDRSIKRCVHFEGTAQQVSREDAPKAHEVYSAKFGGKQSWIDEALSDDKNVRAYYIFKPKKFVLFDQVNFPPGEEYQQYTPDQ